MTVLHPLDLTIEAGEMIAIVGASGSGKSTLMNLLGCLDRPSSGQYLFRGQDTATLDALSLARLRCHHFGFIFQRYHLLPHLNAAAVGDPGRLRRYAADRAPGPLPGAAHAAGAQRSQPSHPEPALRRPAAAGQYRPALANGGEVILADEPTGALDSQSGKEVMAILKELHAQGHTIILVTHDMEVASHADRIITLKDGRVQEDSGRKPAAAPSPRPPSLPVRKGRPRLGSLPGSGAHGAARHAGPPHAHLPHHAWHHHRHRRRGERGGARPGARAKVIDQINAMGTNTIDIFPAKIGGREGRQHPDPQQAGSDALLGQPYLEGASPQIAAPVSCVIATRPAAVA